MSNNIELRIPNHEYNIRRNLDKLNNNNKTNNNKIIKYLIIMIFL
jgi:hypothetical protein